MYGLLEMVVGWGWTHASARRHVILRRATNFSNVADLKTDWS